MFTPATNMGKLFQRYVKSFDHPSKIRILNFIGKVMFKKGILLKNVDGACFCLDPNDWITRTILLAGNYEPHSVQLAKSILKNGGLFVDVGANFGLFTCQVGKLNCDISAIAIEPNYKILGTLINNVKLNNLQEQVKIFNMALSDEIGFLNLEQPVSNNIGTTVTNNSSKGTLLLFCSSLNFFYKQNINEQIALMKIDIEGSEFNILKNFSFELYPVKNFILEYNGIGATGFIALRDFFSEKGYNCFSIDGKPLEEISGEILENNIWFAKKNI
jgi:FkbM family methyltransferase